MAKKISYLEQQLDLLTGDNINNENA